MTVVFDSTQRGFLREDSPAILEDPDLTDLLQACVWQITGLPATMVRPRWQSTPPNQPTIDQSWCAIGIVNRSPQDYPYFTHHGWKEGGAGNDLMLDWSTFEVLASFYGPGAAGNAGRLRRGLYVGQNRDVLADNGIKVREVGEINSVPDLFNQQYVDHVDVHVYMAREVKATFPIRNIASATTEIISDTGGVITAETDSNTPDQPFILDNDANGLLDSQNALG
jgi:hypothetical protein